MKNLLRIAKITLQFKKTLLLNLLFNILGMVFSLFSFAMIIPLLRVIFNAEESIKSLANFLREKEDLNITQLNRVK